MAHTPGPWVLNGWDVVQSNCTDAFPALASIHNGDGALCMEEINANARLIAAAPDLLAALRDMVAMVEREYAGFDAIPEWQAAAAAIRKAEGK